jgi:NAD(P)-dependent dehydrogenase (short-subunit alcohol dehydrogenase family)
MFATYPSLKDRVVFITGGASGIGAELVRAFVGQGSRVAFVDILEAEGAALASETGTRYVRCDITDVAALQQAVAEAGATLGPIGVLVNNAANDERHEAEAVTSEYWDESLAVNLKPQFFAAQAVRPQMQSLGGGSIVNFSSTNALYGSPNLAAYATAKAAILGLTRSLARAFGPDNIRVNAILPGAVITERQRALWYRTDAAVAELVSRQVLQKVLLPDEVARMVLFLASEDSRMITKQTFVVDAGISS